MITQMVDIMKMFFEKGEAGYLEHSENLTVDQKTGILDASGCFNGSPFIR